MQLNKKHFSKIVKDLFKSIERLRKSGKIQVDSNAKKIIVLDGQRKNYSALCQILRSKHYLYAV